jgi:hypothetical protein
MTESEVSQVEAVLDAGVPLAILLTVRARVLDEIRRRKAEAEAKMDAPDVSDAAWREASGHFAALNSFLIKAQRGGNWRQWLYLIPAPSDLLPIVPA